ncbi:MAG: 4-hydroxybenzoyl-CoA reductase subunit alpha [Candidatus Lambdaproteobacteria bacterium]|nr:4-hydroxybenzoyl-CoA reductase subunit alpha [Candidatus Lambdaproteobacteria bacterium]
MSRGTRGAKGESKQERKIVHLEREALQTALGTRQHKYIGKPQPLIDGVDKSTGRGKYSGDFNFPDALVGRILRSPHAHARIVSIDVSAALAMEGVRAVVTGADTDTPFGVLPVARDEYALAKEKVRYKGEEVAAVAAVDAWTAEQALAAIQVVYEPLRSYTDPREAMADGAEQIQPHKPGNIEREVDHEFGDVDAGFAASDAILEEEFYAPEVTHAQMEPHAAVGQWDEQHGRLTLWCSTQVPYYVHMSLSAVMGLDMSQIRVIKPMVGGGFGCKTEAQSYEMICGLLARKARGTVKLVVSREEVFFAHRGRPATWTRLRLGCTNDGRLQAVSAEVIQRGGAYGGYGVVTILYAGALLNAIYNIRNVRYKGFRVLTNTPANGAMRGHGTVDTRFAFESMLDMMARKLGLDAVELRKRNLLQTPTMTVNDLLVNSYGYPECIDKVLEASHYHAKVGKLPFGKGIGFAGSHYCSGSAKPVNRSHMPHAVVTMKLDIDGSITLFTGAAEIGQGSSTVMMQIAAEVIGVSPARFRVVAADSAITPKDNGSYSSRVTLYVGNATVQAAERMRDVVFQAAARGLNAFPIDVELVGDEFRLISDPDKTLPFKDMVEIALSYEGTIVTKGTYATPKITHGGENYRGAGIGASPAFSYSAQAVEVDVDIRTGKVTVENVTVAHDCGFALNPLSVRGQVEGSVWMGMAQGRQEETNYENGLPLAPNLLDYRFPTIMESPPIETIIVESNESGGPFGAKEAGEGSLAAFLPALANAIHDAIGVRVKDLPLSPEKVHAAIQQARKARKVSAAPIAEAGR